MPIVEFYEEAAAELDAARSWYEHRRPLLGDTFASRVAASLLTRIGLSELICKSLSEYEEKALFFAQHPEKLAQLNIVQNKLPLFDATQFARDIEQQYLDIWAKLPY